MEDFYFNITSQNESYNHNNITSNYSNITFLSTNSYYYDNIDFYFVVRCIIIGIGLPLTLVAIYALYCQVRNDQVAPIYVINLLISDLIQLCCLIVWVVPPPNKIFIITYVIHVYSLMASVGFMVCIALERYLVIAHPLWYRYRRSIKISVVVCVLVWVLTFVFRFPLYAWVDFKTNCIILGIFFFLPLPLFIFFLGGTLKALSTTRVPSDEKRRIVGVLVLVLLIYTLLFLPAIIWLLSQGDLHNITLEALSLCLQLSPLADLILYIFMRKGSIDKLLSSVCCCRMDSDDTNSSSV